MERSGDEWHLVLPENLTHQRYTYRIEKEDGSSVEVVDPRAHAVDSRPHWGFLAKTLKEAIYSPKGVVCTPPPFDWEGIAKPNIPWEESLFYEAHVRGFGGSFLGLIETIPHLQELGITAIELLPIYEFDECEHFRCSLQGKTPLGNYWGYSPTSFFALNARYSSTGNPEEAFTEFCQMVREFHRAKIEVILDVVYNHTGTHPSLFLQQIDQEQHYHMSEQGFANYSGCGNTLNTNHPKIRTLILDSLRFWAREAQVDGFRFDLASIFYRDRKGRPSPFPTPILQKISEDPLLADCKLIAEPWDAAGLYHVDDFYPNSSRWRVWNGRFRDAVRRFTRGDHNQKRAFAKRFERSSGVNFVTCHDGFTLHDLVSYNRKHNEGNGEDNRDGCNHNDSWNCGQEGPTNDPVILERRERQMRNLLLICLLARGTPMLHMGDEYGHTRHGNNNGYCVDGPLNWFDWEKLQKDPSLKEFIKKLVDLRKKHARGDIIWHGKGLFAPNWERDHGILACQLSSLYIAFNLSAKEVSFQLPKENVWKPLLYTAKRPVEKQGSSVKLQERSILVLQKISPKEDH